MIDQPTKDKLLPLLVPDFMPSDESELCTDSDNSEENDTPSRNSQKKILWYHELVWRSSELDSYIKSLDRKIERRRSTKGKQMVLPIKKDDPARISSRQPPEGAPEWAVSPFFD